MKMSLTCDVKECGHVMPIDDFTEDKIGTECPNCGASLLTRADYEEGLLYAEAFKDMQAAGLLLDDDAEGDNVVGLQVNPREHELNLKLRWLK